MMIYCAHREVIPQSSVDNPKISNIFTSMGFTVLSLKEINCHDA